MMIKGISRYLTDIKYRRRYLKVALVTPGMFCLVVFVLVPCLSLVLLSFLSRGEYGTINWVFTWENLKRLIGFNLFGWSPDFIWIIWRSFREALITTVACIILSYPLSFYIATRKTAIARFVWLILLTVPFCTNIVIRTYAWQLILGPSSFFIKPLVLLGFIEANEPLYPGAIAVYLGMITTFLPFMAFPLYSSIERLNWVLPEAAKDLGANSYKIFTTTILTQTIHGLFAGIIITFVPAMAMFVVTDILGGAKYMLVGNLIQQQFTQARDWPFGAALSLALMTLTLLSLLLFKLSKLYSGGERSVY